MKSKVLPVVPTSFNDPEIRKSLRARARASIPALDDPKSGALNASNRSETRSLRLGAHTHLTARTSCTHGAELRTRSPFEYIQVNT